MQAILRRFRGFFKIKIKRPRFSFRNFRIKLKVPKAIKFLFSLPKRILLFPVRLIRSIFRLFRRIRIKSWLLKNIRSRRALIFTIFILVMVIGFNLTIALNEPEELQIFLGLLAIGVPTYIAVSWIFEKWQLFKQLKNENTNAELMLLKSQINPHFFFNTLNNLYGLTVEKSDKAPEVVLKISDMMRYTIYEGQKDKVPLEDELEYLSTYIELHKIRYQKKVDIKFTHYIQGEGFQITPLLFVILLENAIKHGIESMTENAYAHLSLIAGNNKVVFAIENNYDPNEQKEPGGIGLKNLERRLELLYPEKYHLLVANEDEVYKVQLEIDLT